jgi:hypothetical protein
MKFDLSKFPVSDDDTQLKDEMGKFATYRTVLMKAAANEFDENGQPLRGSVKMDRYDLYLRIKKLTSNFIDFSAEDLVALNVGILGFPIVIAGQARDFLKAPLPEVQEVGPG